MALVKTSKLSVSGPKSIVKPEPPVVSRKPPKAGADRRRASAVGSQRDQVAERIAAATEQLASGLMESAAAAEELRRAMGQIASGAEEAAGGSHEQMVAIKSTVETLGLARAEAETSRRKTESVQLALLEAATQITACIRAIEKNAERQQKSVTVISTLEQRASDIGEITETVSRLSDQTNLVALNAAIEAARAGDHGRGFAVVAEEVSALAEVSDRSAKEVQELSGGIQDKVRQIVTAVESCVAAVIQEVKTGADIIKALEAMRPDMATISEGSQNILVASIETERAATEVQRGAEQISSAAEQQSSGASSANAAIREQAHALDQAQSAASSLAKIAERVRSKRNDGSDAHHIAAAAEELSATVQELSGAASEIMASVGQIDRGSQQQAAATQQTSAAIAQIEKNAMVAQSNARSALGQVTQMVATLKESQSAIEGLVAGVSRALTETRKNLDMVTELEALARKIEKNVDGIAIVAVQTNMLAVSGAVEAARAADAGHGFSVVSSDIRGLARESSQSADRIRDNVRGVVDHTQSVRRDLEQIIAAAESEIDKNLLIAGLFGRVGDEVALLKDTTEMMVGRANSILSSAAEAAAGARQIAAAADQAGAAARQAATASVEQARGVEDLAAAVEEIASLADELNK